MEAEERVIPRNGSGTFSVTNSFTSGTTIASADVNANFSDVGSEITNSLPRDGQASMTGQLKAANGTAAAPGMTFGADTNTGFFRKDADTIGVAAGGVEVGTIGASGLVDANSNVVVGLPTGVTMMYCATTAPTGWVRLNGRTIGNASSGATERANADTATLYALLWSAYSNSVCPVSTGRGVSAAADYAANKTLGLPDVRGRAFFGLDDMGNSAAGRLGSVLTNPTTNGDSGGTERVTLDGTQIPAHGHEEGSLIASDGGGHTPQILYTPTTGDGGGGTRIAAIGSGGSTANGVAVPDHGHNVVGTTDLYGDGLPHSNMPPAFLTTFIIKL